MSVSKLATHCQGPCGKEVPSAEMDSFGWCALCQIMDKVTPHYAEYKRLFKKLLRYQSGHLPHASIQAQMGRVVGRIANACHAKLPVDRAVRLVNEICETARAEVEGFSKIQTVTQVRQSMNSRQPKSTRSQGPEKTRPNLRKTESGILLP